MECSIRTTRPEEFIDITHIVIQAVRKSGVENGVVIVFVPHTTAGITINENADPDVVHDMLLAFRRVFAESKDFRHVEGNSHAHVKASVVGSSCTIIIQNGKPKLGTWQGIYFCEFDGPRARKVYVKVISD